MIRRLMNRKRGIIATGGGTFIQPANRSDMLLAVLGQVPLDRMLADLDPHEPFPVAELGTPRGRQGSPRRVVLPEGWLEDAEGAACAVPEDMHSGG